MKEISTEELIVRYGNGERDFSGFKVFEETLLYFGNFNGGFADLKGVDLSGIDLRGACLKEVDLTGATLDGADLAGAFLRGSILIQASIRNANLHSTNLITADLTDADLTDSTLCYMNATAACFKNARFGPFEYAVLAETYFRGARTTRQLLCRGGNLIWNTTMPDGSIEIGPQWGDGQGR